MSKKEGRGKSEMTDRKVEEVRRVKMREGEVRNKRNGEEGETGIERKDGGKAQERGEHAELGKSEKMTEKC